MVDLTKQIVGKIIYLGLPGLSLVFVLSGFSLAFSQQRIGDIVRGKTPQGYAYMSGGVGLEERSQMIKQLKKYDLKLSFADRAGEYLSDVKVMINEEHGKEIVNTTSNGPWFYIELPSGKYDVKATFDDRTEKIKDLQISKDHLAARLLHWDFAGYQMSRR